MKFAFAGLVTGSVVAAALARLLSSVLVAVRPSDPLVFALAAVFTILITLAAAMIPARRALLVDPALALRFE